MPALRGFEAHILIDGKKKLPEYNVEVADDRKSVTCWVPSQEGKKFTVQWTDTKRKYMTDGLVKLDGVECGGQTLERTCRRPTATIDHVLTSATTARPFMFAPLELTDDDQFLDESQDCDIGTIELSIDRVAKIRQSGTTNGQAEYHCPTDRKIHEKAKKVADHYIKFGDEHKVKSGPGQQVQIQTLDDEPIAIFHFKYRSLGILQANGIALPPSPPRDDKKRKGAPESEDQAALVENLEAEEALLKKKLEAVQRKRAKVARGHGDHAVKVEPPNSMILVEVIDLT